MGFAAPCKSSFPKFENYHVIYIKPHSAQFPDNGENMITVVKNFG
jgi:hypothetical protein